MNKLEICNSALQRIGVPRVMSLVENSKEARACNTEFEQAKRFVLRSHAWGFASRRVVLAPLVTAPAFGFTYEFALPGDFIRLIELYQYDDEFTVEGTSILANAETLSMRYVADVSVDNVYDAVFTDSLAWYLAFTIARSLTESETVRQEAFASFKSSLPFARFVQSSERTQPTMETETLYDTGRDRFVRDPMT